LVRASEVVIDNVVEPVAAPRKRAPVGRDEPQRAVRFLHDAVPAFVMQTMMIRAQQRDVAEVRLAAVDPVLAVMTGEIAVAVTTRERAVAIAGVKGSA
jgi:hypothetical protein